ncbi:hypothetical protein [Streptomyces roseolus]|uniref:hypothetical protein n=1 Tax=Streptomyces roseolus TaxID=67358 RepID=UPI0016744C91|nr:hypothetical protein [Streptomyces roseolus]GGR40221.1 hypothetical protein GCM10010282_36220 [Streptomyces roseolus]
MSLIPPEVAAFVIEASRLPLAALDEIRDATARAVASGEYEPDAVPEFDAARFATLRKAVRDAFHPRSGELRAGRPGGLRAAIGCTTMTAQAVWKRDGLSAADYAVLTGAFLAHGVGVPARTPG